MKKRYLYALLFAAPGFFLSLIISFAVFGMTAGILWLHVFGDNPWPANAEKALLLLFSLTFLGSWSVLTAAGFVIGKKLEADPRLNRQHQVVSATLSFAFMLFITLHQLRVGNLETKTDTQLCSDFCLEKGYPASGMPPRASGQSDCICYDSGREALRVPIKGIVSGN
jgi:hypothetical protein